MNYCEKGKASALPFSFLSQWVVSLFGVHKTCDTIIKWENCDEGEK